MRCSGVRKKPGLSSATHELEKVVDDPDALFGALETAEALTHQFRSKGLADPSR